MSLYPSLEDLKVDKVIQVWLTLKKMSSDDICISDI